MRLALAPRSPDVLDGGVDLREKGEKQNSSYNGVSCARGMDFKHDRSRKQTEEEEEDPVEKMIMKTGCIEQHYKVQVHFIFEIIRRNMQALKFPFIAHVNCH